MLSRHLAVALVLAAIGFGGCAAGDSASPSAPDPWDALNRIGLQYRAANLSTMAPYNVLPLVATPRDTLGQPLTGLPAPTFRTNDTTRVRVTADGVVTALAPGKTLVIATLIDATDTTQPPLAYTDTITIDVKALADPPVLTTFSIHPPVPADTLVPMPSSPFADVLFDAAGIVLPSAPRVRALDAMSAEIVGLEVAYESLDHDVATVDRRTGLMAFVHPGRVRLVAHTYAYGVAQADTVTLTVTWPAAADIQIRPGSADGIALQTPAGASAAEVKVMPGGTVVWSSYVGDAVDVIFDAPANATAAPTEVCTLLTDELGPGAYCGTGNLTVPANANPADDFGFLPTIRLRRFATPGVYPYQTSAGASGQIVVSY